MPQLLSGIVSGCGCSSTVVQLYHCDRFNEPVLKHAAARCLDKIKAKVPGYTGRTCRECVVPKGTETAPAKPADRFDVEKHFADLPYHPSIRNIAAVTCHFNPQRSQSRVRCYETFARQFPRIGMELFTVEGSLDDRWEIPGACRFALDPESCLFAKESLLNLAITRLPDHFERVLWIDSDVLILDRDYAEKVAAALDASPVTHGFSLLRYLGPNGEQKTDWRSSLGWVNHQRKSHDSTLHPAYPGGIWAARRELLVSVGGLYDRCITGSGDVAWASAAYGAKARSNQMVHWSDALVRGVLDYCARVGPLVDRVGCVDAKAVHVYHGELKHRQYQARHRVLRETDFDPERHVEYASNGTLRWSDTAPAALRNGVRNYLLNRGEDSEPSYT